MKERVEKLRKLLEQNRLDGALITGLTAIRYYSGFTSDEAALVITLDHASLLTDFRYTIQAREQSPDFEVVEVGRGALLPTVDRLFMYCARSASLMTPAYTMDFKNSTAMKPARARPANGSVP